MLEVFKNTKKIKIIPTIDNPIILKRLPKSIINVKRDFYNKGKSMLIPSKRVLDIVL
jgi:hypothetical protein